MFPHSGKCYESDCSVLDVTSCCRPIHWRALLAPCVAVHSPSVFLFLFLLFLLFVILASVVFVAVSPSPAFAPSCPAPPSPPC